MILSDEILNRVIKNKLNRKRGVYIMNNYALFNDVLIEDFEKDIKLSDITSIQDELHNLCDPDNIFTFSEFEIKKREILEGQKSNFSKELEKNDDMEQVVLVSKEFVPNELIEKNKLLLSDLKKQIKSLKFKIFYYEVQKRQEILDSDISKAVKTADEIESLKEKLEEVIHKYFVIIEELNNIQIDNCNKYLSMINDFCKDKKIPTKMSMLVSKYSEFIVNRFLIDKLVYLILTNLGTISKEKIVKAIESDEFIKMNYSFIFEDILERLRDVGTDSKLGDK